MWVDVDTAVTVPVNILPLTDDTDFKTIETGVAYNASGMALKWNFVTAAGGHNQTAVTPTTSGVYDWSHLGGGMYTIEIPASGGGSINNDLEGFGWFSGVATGVLPWRGPIIGFRAAGLNDALVDNAYSTTRGLAGTALPNAAAEASGGLPTLSAAQASNGTIQANVHRWLTGTPNALQSGRVDSYLGAVASGVIAAASFAANALDAVWSTATRVLTAGTNIVLAKGTGVTGFNDLDAAGVRAAVGLASANLDTQLAALPTAAENADQVWEEAIADHSGTAGSTAEKLAAAASAGDPWSTALPGSYSPGEAGYIVGNSLDDTVSSRSAPGDAMTLTSGERSTLAAALLDLSNAIETGVTLRQAQRVMLAALAGKLSGATSSTITFRNAEADSKDRIVATVDGNGNRTAITLDLT